MSDVLSGGMCLMCCLMCVSKVNTGLLMVCLMCVSKVYTGLLMVLSDVCV